MADPSSTQILQIRNDINSFAVWFLIGQETLFEMERSPGTTKLRN